jgi:hypothetical protein
MEGLLTCNERTKQTDRAGILASTKVCRKTYASCAPTVQWFTMPAARAFGSGITNLPRPKRDIQRSQSRQGQGADSAQIPYDRTKLIAIMKAAYNHTPSKADHKEKPELLKSGCCCLCRILSGTGPFRRSVIFTFAVIFVSLFQLEVTILTFPPVIGAMPLGFIDGDSILLNEVLIGVRNSLDEVRRIVFVSFSACLSPVSAALGETCIDDYSSFWFCFGFCSWHN